MPRSAILILFLILIVAGIAILIRRPVPVQEGSVRAEQIVLTGHKEDGSPAWSIQAQTGSLDEGSGMLESVELALFEDPDAPIIVRGDRLSRDSGSSTLSGSIHVDQEDVLSLETETILWDERNEVLESGPVVIEMEAATIEAGAFHHDLGTSLSTLTRGVEARLVQDEKEYVVRSASAEATPGRLILLGGVSVESEDGDNYQCQQLESDTAQSSIHLVGEVSGVWQRSTFSADDVLLDEAGIRLHGDVTIDLELLMMDEPHDT